MSLQSSSSLYLFVLTQKCFHQWLLLSTVRQRQRGSEKNLKVQSSPKVPWRADSSATASFLWNRNCKYCYCNFVQNCQGSLWLMMMTYGNTSSASLISTAVSNRNLPGGSILEGKVNCTKGRCTASALWHKNTVQHEMLSLFSSCAKFLET